MSHRIIAAFFQDEVACALREGASILILIDGLCNADVVYVAKEILHLHESVAMHLRRARTHESDAGLQCVLTCEGEPQFEEGRLVTLLPLDDAEKMLIARHRLLLCMFEDTDEGAVGVSCEEIARIICDKEEACLPLMITTCANEAARFAREDVSHRTVSRHQVLRSSPHSSLCMTLTLYVRAIGIYHGVKAAYCQLHSLLIVMFWLVVSFALHSCVQRFLCTTLTLSMT